MAHVRHLLHSSQQKNGDRKTSNGRVLLLTLPNQTTRNSTNLAMPFRAPPKLLTYITSIPFADFKRYCGEKLGISCTRVFTLSGGEVDTVSQLEKDDTLICSSGETYLAPEVKQFEKKYRESRNSSPPPSSVKNIPINRSKSITGNQSGVVTKKSALNRFKSVVRRVQQNRGKHMGTTNRSPSSSSSSTVIVPISNSGSSSISNSSIGSNNSNGSHSSGSHAINNRSNTTSINHHTLSASKRAAAGEHSFNNNNNNNNNNSEDINSWSSCDAEGSSNANDDENYGSVEGRRRSSVWDTDEISTFNYKRTQVNAKRKKKLQERGRALYPFILCWETIRSKFVSIEGGTSEDDPVREVFAPPLIYPEHPYRLGWDCILTLLVIYYSLAVPLRLAFTLAHPSDGETIFDIICSFLFIIDIGLNFCTAIKIRGVTITDHKVIARVYLKSWFIIDFISSLPVDLIFLGQTMNGDDASSSLTDSFKMLKSLRIFKLLRVLRLQRIINRLETHHHVDPSLLRMGKLIGILITTWHWLGCSYWGTAEFEFGYSRVTDDAWIPPPHVWQADNLGTQYAFAFFWAVVVTSGIGWDIIPSTSLQIVFTTFAIVTGLLIYAIIIGSASTLLANIDSIESERRSKMNEVKSLLRNRHVPKTLSAEIFEFYEYLLSCNNSSIDEYSILSELPQSLRSRLNIAINRQIIKSIPVFGGCSDSAMALLIEQLYQLVILPGEYVMEQGMQGNEMYFVVRGKLQVLRDTEQGHRITMAKRGEGDFFGEIALFENLPRGASVKAITYCDLLTLPREGFEYLKIHFPGIMDNMRSAADRRKQTIDFCVRASSLKASGEHAENEDNESGNSAKSEYVSGCEIVEDLEDAEEKVKDLKDAEKGEKCENTKNTGIHSTCNDKIKFAEDLSFFLRETELSTSYAS